MRSDVPLHSSRARTASEVPLDRNATAVVTFAPCSKATRAAPRYNALVQQIWGLIREEAYRATVS